MKKQRVIVLLSGIAMIFILAGASYAADRAGEVLAVKKNVYVVRGDSRDDAKPKMDLLIKDAVETESKSRAKLFFTDDSILNLAEQSRVSVEEYLYSPEKQRSKSIYNLIDGSIKVVVGRSDLEVHTDSAVAAARGTTFLMKKRKLKNEECDAIREREGIQGEIRDRDRECVETCVYVLDDDVQFRLKDIKDKDEKEKPEKYMVTVREDEAYCMVGNKIFSKEPDAKMLSAWRDEFPVYANTFPAGAAVPAFAPEPPAFPDVVVDPPFDQNPDGSAPEAVEDIDIFKQGDFERIDPN